MRLSEILDRILLGGYEAAQKAASRQIVARYARGNAAVQQGRFINEDDLKELRDAGDKAMQNIRDWRLMTEVDATGSVTPQAYHPSTSNAISKDWPASL